MPNTCPTCVRHMLKITKGVNECFSISNKLSESVISFLCLTCVYMCRTGVRQVRPTPINFLPQEPPLREKHENRPRHAQDSLKTGFIQTSLKWQ